MSNFELPNLNVNTPSTPPAAQPSACPANPEPVSAFDATDEAPKPQAPNTDILSPNAGDETGKFEEVQKKDNLEILNTIQNVKNDIISDNLSSIEKKQPFRQIFNDDGSINPGEIGELFTSGKMDGYDFLNALGFDLRTPEGQGAVGLSRSDTFGFTMEDGTKVSGLLDSSWTASMGWTPSITITTPDGQEYSFKCNVNRSK